MAKESALRDITEGKEIELKPREIEITEDVQAAEPSWRASSGMTVFSVVNARHENMAFPKGQRMMQLGADILGLL